MTPLRAQMIHDMQLQRLAPQTQKAYVTAVAGLAKFYQCSPVLSPLRKLTKITAEKVNQGHRPEN
jgi:hypothetical protein